MSDKGMDTRYKQELKRAREHHGRLSDARNAECKQGMLARKGILEALAAGPRTVPELAQSLGIDPRTALWQVAALRKYNHIADGNKQGEFFTYVRK